MQSFLILPGHLRPAVSSPARSVPVHAGSMITLCALATFGLVAGASADQPAAILEKSEVRGGLVVVLGCDDPQLVSGLRANESYVVQSLDTDEEKVEAVRAHLRREGVYGAVSARTFDGKHLPFIDNLLNLIVHSGDTQVPKAEVTRALAPGGVAVTAQGEVLQRKVWPDDIDEWTHFLHGPDNNAVAHDTQKDEPRHMQWIAAPRWSRHHDRMASLSAAVSARGRLFYIMDQGSRVSPLLPSRWKLTARDAFNGVPLWERAIPQWYPHLWPLKSGPAWLPRRLVAKSDCVYVTLGLRAAVSQLDAATGRTIRTYPETEGTSEILIDDDLLLLAVDRFPTQTEYVPHAAEPGTPPVSRERDMAAKNSAWDWTPKRIVAIQAQSGKVLWEQKYPVAPLSMAMNALHVVFHNGDAIVCLDRVDGKELWRTRPDAALQGSPRNWYDKTVEAIGGRLGKALPSSFAPTLVLHEDVVLFSGGDGKLCGLDQKSGKQLWVGKCLASGHYSPEDVLVVGGLVWTADIAHSRSSGRMIGLDPRTGEVKRTIQCNAKIHWFHQRCYRSKATDRYLLTSRTGIEFVDHEAAQWHPNHWVRGGCLYGILPCNGLIYTPPHNCACYLEAKVYGFTALAPERKRSAERLVRSAKMKGRLKRGPAFAASGSQLSTLSSPASSDWPVFRHDNQRSGRLPCKMPTALKEVWRADFTSRASQATVSGNRVCVAVPDLHAVVCVAADTGREQWRFTASGRVDSPPTLVPERGLCVFGSADGYVYCLSLDSGEMVWRFRAGPTDRALVAFDQPESLWPVSGSVLVRENVITFVAGRSVFVDGGLRMTRLDLESGDLLSEQVMDDRDPAQPNRQFQYRLKALNMPVGLPDILSCDGTHMYMRSQMFDLAGRRLHLNPAPSSPNRAQSGAHLFSPTGFLDDTWMHRSYWVYGTGFDEGAGGWPNAGRVVPAGRILCFDEKTVYGYGRKPKYFAWSTPLEYHLFAAAKPGAEKQETAKGVRHRWSRATALHVQAIISSEEKLFVAGPQALVDEPAALVDPFGKDMRRQLVEQEDALRGQRGALLQVVSTREGETLAELDLDYLPAFDGMAAAKGRLFVASQDGSLVCYGGCKTSGS